MVKVTGIEQHKRRLQRMRGARMVNAVTQALYKTAQDIQVDAQLSISAGAVSGKNHEPSEPGTPPNNDTGVLAGNIEAAIVGPLKAETSSNAPYALAQEMGSEKLGLPERPYLRPALKKNQENGRKRVVDVVNRVVSQRG